MKLGLRLLFWGAGAQTGVRLVQSAWFRGEHRYLARSLHIESFRDAFDWFVPVFLTLASLAASVLMVIGAWRLAADARGRARIFLASAAGGLAGSVLAHLPNAAFSIGILERVAIPSAAWSIVSGVGFILFTLGMLALLAGMMELAREAKLRIPWAAGGVLAGLYVLDGVYWMIIARFVGARFVLGGGWWHLLFTAVDLVQTVLLLALLDGLAQEAPRTRSAHWSENAGWSLAADGLRSYRTALLCRIFLPVGALLLVLMAVGMRVFALAATAAIAMPFLIVVFSIWMLIGIQRFAAYVPQESEARTSAGVAAKLMIVAAILDAVALCVLMLVLIDRHAIEHGQETSQAMGSAAQLMAVIGTFILLGAFRRVGQFVGLADAGRRVRIVAILTGVSAALVTQLQLGGEDTARMLRHLEGADATVLILLGLAMLAAGIWALVVYVGLLGRLRDAMSTAAAPL